MKFSKLLIIGCLSIVGVVLFAKLIFVKTDKNFPVSYTQKIERVGYEPAPAQWQIDISPALALKKAKSFGSYKVFEILGIICLLGAGVWIFLLNSNRITMGGSGGNVVLFVILAAYLSCEYAAYSRILTNNSVTIEEAQFVKITGINDHSVKSIKDNTNKDIEKLFDKPVIR